MHKDGTGALLTNTRGIPIRGSVASLITVDVGWENAIAAALGDLADAVGARANPVKRELDLVQRILLLREVPGEIKVRRTRHAAAEIRTPMLWRLSRCREFHTEVIQQVAAKFLQCAVVPLPAVGDSDDREIRIEVR